MMKIDKNELRTDEINILMLEDNPDDVELTSMALSKSSIHFTMKVIATKKELYTEELSDYDLVLCDYKLTDFDGLRSVRYIRKHTNIPIIIVTGAIDEKMGFDLLEAGADEFLKKSCLDKVSLLVDKSMRNYELRDRAMQCKRKLEETSQMFDSLFEGINNPLFIKNSKGQYERVNASFCKLYKRSEGDILGKTDGEINWSHSGSISVRDDEFVLTKGISSNYELDFIDELGRKTWLDVNKTPIFIDNEIIGILGQARDITHAKNAVATMERSVQVLYQAEELTRSGSFEYDVELDLVTCSKNMMKMLGFHSNQVSFSRLVRLVKKEDRPILLEGIHNSIEAKCEYRMEHRFVLKNKRSGYFEILFKPDYRDETGNTFYGIVMDITEESKASISRLEYHENVKTEIARELHDNLGQKLNVASMFLGKSSNCKKCAPVSEKVSNVLHESIDDLGQLLSQISVRNVDDISLKYALEKLMEYIPETMNLDLRWELEETGLSGFVKKQIFRVIQETVNNAIKYSGAKNLTITLSKEGDLLNVEVEDDGNGFDINAHHKGNGLLNITHRVKKSNGMININSKAGKGTSVRVKMPAA